MRLCKRDLTPSVSTVKFCYPWPKSARSSRFAAIIRPTMDRQGRIFRRTDSGLKACATRDPAVSDDDRRILGLIHGDMHGDVIRTLLRRHADYRRLADLEARGLIASEAAAPERDLDFTGSFAMARTLT